jgi:hypothetical protein
LIAQVRACPDTYGAKMSGQAPDLQVPIIPELKMAGPREWMQRHSVIVAVCALAAAVIALILNMRHLGGATDLSLDKPAYFYDLSTGELFVDEMTAVPPIDAPSSGRGVAAHVFACGDCADQTQHFIAYLSTQTDENKARIASGDMRIPPPPQVAAVPQVGEDPQWIDPLSPRGVEIKTITRCGETQPLACRPN